MHNKKISNKYYCLSREEFVKICTKAILHTRKKITISNQLDGYKKFHREIRDNHYLAYIRDIISGSAFNVPSDRFKFVHDIVDHTGIGNCDEMAYYLLVEIAKRIDSRGGGANLHLVRCKKVDHNYVEVDISLKAEKSVSTWQVDAWDPRIIDISTAPRGVIRNFKHIKYGCRENRINSIVSGEINFKKTYSFFNVRKPVSGKPRSPTPERQILQKNKHLYSNYSLCKAERQGFFDRSGKVGPVQRALCWQKRELSHKNDLHTI